MDEIITRIQNAFDKSEVLLNGLKRELKKNHEKLEAFAAAHIVKPESKSKKLRSTTQNLHEEEDVEMTGTFDTPNFSETLVKEKLRNIGNDNRRKFAKRVPRSGDGTPISSRAQATSAVSSSSRPKKLMDITNTKKNETIDDNEGAFKVPTRPMPGLKPIEVKHLTFDDLLTDDENAPEPKYPAWAMRSKRKLPMRHQKFINVDGKTRELSRKLKRKTFSNIFSVQRFLWKRSSPTGRNFFEHFPEHTARAIITQPIIDLGRQVKSKLHKQRVCYANNMLGFLRESS